jgi:hypothetical protein
MWISNLKSVAQVIRMPIRLKIFPSSMSNFNLSDEEIDSILAYINESAGLQVVAGNN